MLMIPSKDIAQGKVHNVISAINNSIVYKTEETVWFDNEILLHWVLVEIKEREFTEGLEFLLLDNAKNYTLIELRGKQCKVFLRTSI